jgi:hypothetical protein
VQYYPFKGRPGKNPCLTILSRAYQISYGLAWNATNPGITQIPDMWCVQNTDMSAACMSSLACRVRVALLASC